jgi:serine protease Do
LAKQLSVAPRAGVAVTEVFPKTPAAKSGLQSGDVIVKFDGQAVRDPQQLQLVVERSEFGKTLMIDIVRDGKAMQLNYTPEEQPGDFGLRSASKSEGRSSQRMENYGLEVAPMDAEVAQQLGMQGVEGVVITAVAQNSPAANAGLDSGMVITQVNRRSVTSVEQFVQAMEENKGADGALLLVRTENGSRFVVLK